MHALLLFVCALAVYWFFWTLLVWYRYHPHLPWRDTFLVLTSIAPLLEADVDLTSLLSLFELHYSAHRIAVVRLLVLLDVGFFNGQNHLLYAAAWLSMLAMLALYVKAAHAYFAAASASTVFVAALAMLLLFAPAHVWNVINPVNTSWHISLAFCTAAFYMLLRRRDALRKRDWALAYVFAALAAFSTFAGVICWLLLPAVALINQRRVFLPAMLLSLVLAVCYAQGMTSDAAVALNWNLGGGEALQQAKAQAQAAISANTPWRILQKTGVLLTWPLADSQRILAAVLAAASLALLAFFWLRSIYLLVTGKGRQALWLELCMLCALLCVATLAAANMGRVIEQPNYMHGPSYERYQTLNSVYWMSVLGLLMSVTKRWSRPATIALMMASTTTVLVLMAPNGNYLKQEINSAEYAAKLYMTGERAQLRNTVSNKLARFTPEFVFSFDDFFAEYQIAYRVSLAAPDPALTTTECNDAGLSFSFRDANKKGVQSIQGRIETLQAFTTREMTLFSGGELVGRLYPQHSGDFAPAALLQRKHNHWRGLLETAKITDGEAVLVATTIFSRRPLCRLVLPPEQQ